VNEYPRLVDEPGIRKGLHQCRAAERNDVAAIALFQFFDLLFDAGGDLDEIVLVGPSSCCWARATYAQDSRHRVMPSYVGIR
jgi:hypothetical protein